MKKENICLLDSALLVFTVLFSVFMWLDCTRKKATTSASETELSLYYQNRVGFKDTRHDIDSFIYVMEGEDGLQRSLQIFSN